MGHLRRRLAFIALAMAITLAVGTAGFVWIENYPVFDAFYMTLTTVTTVGYGEIHPLSHVGRIFNSFVILFGVVIMLLAIGAMTQTIIELELNQYFGKRRVKSMIEKLEGHIIVCGFGRVGRGAAEELRQAGAPFVIVDRNEERVERAIRDGLLAVLADANRDETLKDVRIDRALGLIATLSSDADNLFLILSAKALNSRLHLSARIAEEASEQKLKRAGADFVFAPYNSTGHRMAQALLKPHVQQFLDFTTQNMGLDAGIEQVRVSERSAFANQSLEEMHVRKELGVIVLAIRKASGEMFFNPPADARIATGDHLIVMGRPDGLRRLEQLLTGVAA
jgi:voltage-gated potassium channel